MVWTALLVFASACLLIQLGAMMVWVALLVAILKGVCVLVGAVAAYVGGSALWRRFKRRDIQPM